MTVHCPIIPPERLEQARANLRRHVIEYPIMAIDESAIAQALDHPATEYMITTSMFWDCTCDQDYIRPAAMLMCEECGELQEDAPPSRINELRRHNIHVDWSAPEAVATLEEHNITARRTVSLPAGV